MPPTRLSRRRWLALAASLAGAVAVGCGRVPPADRPTESGKQPAATPPSLTPAGPTTARASTITATVLALPPTLFHGLGGWSNLSKTEALTGDWLVMPDDEGRLVPRLAREVPTIANGGASWEGEATARRLRVTYRLRDGLVWQDGAPLTSDDVRFAYELQANPEFPLIDRSLVSKVEEVCTPDRQTA